MQIDHIRYDASDIQRCRGLRLLPGEISFSRGAMLIFFNECAINQCPDRPVLSNRLGARLLLFSRFRLLSRPLDCNHIGLS